MMGGRDLEEATGKVRDGRETDFGGGQGIQKTELSEVAKNPKKLGDTVTKPSWSTW